MADCTPEELTRWTRQMAEIEGWTDIRTASLTNTQLVGTYKNIAGRTCKLPNYQRDLNALQRVCEKICENSPMILADGLLKEFKGYPNRHGYAAWQVCLTAAKLFPIVGRVTDKIKEQG